MQKTQSKPSKDEKKKKKRHEMMSYLWLAGMLDCNCMMIECR